LLLDPIRPTLEALVAGHFFELIYWGRAAGTKVSGGAMVFQMERREILARFVASFFGVWFASFVHPKKAKADEKGHGSIKLEGAMILPPPETKGTVSLEEAIQRRRTVRSFLPQPLTLPQVSQVLWAAQGMTSGDKRAAPSAGALYPMDVYAIVGKDRLEFLEAGIYHYEPREHRLSQVTKGDLRTVASRIALSQMWMADAPLIIVITAEYRRIAVKYGDRGTRYAMIEAGHIGQNIFLQAEALGLRAGIVGAFDDEKLNEAMKIPRSHEPLLMMPVGYGRE
jgi:SagB-type dehydrogenase family enzyme